MADVCLTDSQNRLWRINRRGCAGSMVQSLWAYIWKREEGEIYASLALTYAPGMEGVKPGSVSLLCLPPSLSHILPSLCLSLPLSLCLPLSNLSLYKHTHTHTHTPHQEISDRSFKTLSTQGVVPPSLLFLLWPSSHPHILDPANVISHLNCCTSLLTDSHTHPATFSCLGSQCVPLKPQVRSRHSSAQTPAAPSHLTQHESKCLLCPARSHLLPPEPSPSHICCVHSAPATPLPSCCSDTLSSLSSSGSLHRI